MMERFENNSARQAAARWSNVSRQDAWWRTRFASTRMSCGKPGRAEQIKPGAPEQLLSPDTGRSNSTTVSVLVRLCGNKKMKRLADLLSSTKRFRPSCNYCTSFLSSLVPGVSLLSARGCTSSYLGD